MSKKEKEAEVVTMATTAASIGAGAGVGIATLVAAPIVIPALMGAGIACLGTVVLKLSNEGKL